MKYYICRSEILFTLW